MRIWNQQTAPPDDPGDDRARYRQSIGVLDGHLGELEASGAGLVFARPLGADAALRWAGELHLQSPVIADEARALPTALGVGEPDFAVWVLDGGVLRYRKIGGRRPQLDELLAVVEDRAESEGWRCCPAACTGEPCTSTPQP